MGGWDDSFSIVKERVLFFPVAAQVLLLPVLVSIGIGTMRGRVLKSSNGQAEATPCSSSRISLLLFCGDD
eukprot:6500586-Ditylum_brightwellii.AAC.1